MTAWIGRIALAGLVAAAVVLQFHAYAPDYSGAVLAHARQAMEQAGFHVETGKPRAWNDGRNTASHYLTARHPDCSADITVRALFPTDRPAMADRTLESEPHYIYGDWQGRALSPLPMLRNLWSIEVADLMAFGRATAPAPEMLVVTDPSDCLAITSTDWRSIWYGR